MDPSIALELHEFSDFSVKTFCESTMRCTLTFYKELYNFDNKCINLSTRYNIYLAIGNFHLNKQAGQT